MSATMNEEMLINLVRDYPYLYLRQDKMYYNQQLKENAWEEIAWKMNVPVEESKKKWNNLKDCWRKYIAKKKKRKGGVSTDSSNKKWRYEDEMCFLMPTLREKKQKNLLSDADLQESVDNDIQEIESSDSERSETSANKKFPLYNSYMSQTRQDKNHEHIPALENYSYNTSDHIKKYFESAEETFRTFHPELQIEVKQKINGILSEYELKNYRLNNLETSVQKITYPAD